MNPEQQRYIALTLGPIGRTLALAESTKELWAASYFFSYLAKNIWKGFTGKKVIGGKLIRRTFLLPSIDEEMFGSHHGAGLFPDQYIFKAEEGDFELLGQQVDSVLNEIAEKMSELLLHCKHDKDNIRDFLTSYLKIYFLEKTFPANTVSQEVVSACEHALNLMEMQDAFPPRQERNYLQELFRRVSGRPVFDVNDKKKIIGFTGSFLSNEEFEGQGRLFDSIIEISAAECKTDIRNKYLKNLASENLNSEDDAGNEPKLIKALSNVEEQILSAGVRPRHKYITIVKADIDFMGAATRNMKDSSPLSAALLTFCSEVVETIKVGGGMPVFIGGEDLLFFAPVFYKGQSIFHLLRAIDAKFLVALNKHKVGALSGGALPTLSYGLSITYYKYPMFEALENAEELLTGTAKNSELSFFLRERNATKEDTLRLVRKNRIAFHFRKHSGQAFTGCIDKACERTYELLLGLIGHYTDTALLPPDLEQAKRVDSDNRFLSSVMHDLSASEEMMRLILENEDRKKLLANYMRNNFNKEEHLLLYKGLFDRLQELIICAYEEYRDYYSQAENGAASYNTVVARYCRTDKEKEQWQVDVTRKTIRLIYTVLRLIHFINSERDE